MQSNRIIQVEEKVPPRLLVPLSIQHMFADVPARPSLVPFIFKMNPAIVLFMNGIGTLLFILITKGKRPRISARRSHLSHRRPSLSTTGVISMHSAALLSWVRAAVCSHSLSISAVRTGSTSFCRLLPWARLLPDRLGVGRLCGFYRLHCR